MALPTISGEARLTEDPSLRFSASGVAIASVNLAFNSRRLNKDTNTWEDGDTFYVRGTVFKDHAEHVAETLTRGMAVVVTGRLKTDSWEDREGVKKSSPSLLIDAIGPALARATAKVTKVSREGGGFSGGGSQDPGGFGGGGSQAPQADPWATGPQTDAPPF
jgi:single-strand DNA-binding protein